MRKFFYEASPELCHRPGHPCCCRGVLAGLFSAGDIKCKDLAVIAPADPLTVNNDETGSQEVAELLRSALKEGVSPETSWELVFPVFIQIKGSDGGFRGAYSLYVISMINREAVVEDL